MKNLFVKPLICCTNLRLKHSFLGGLQDKFQGKKLKHGMADGKTWSLPVL
jgi:hypothetical protein